ncbi:MAG: peptidoglycan DD-metalloendopeptidase family protein [Bacteroidota bacterium]
MLACQPQEGNQNPTVSKRIPVPNLKRLSLEQYGISLESRKVVQANFEQNQHLRDILSEYQVSPEKIDELDRKSGEIFDVRLMRAGQPFTVVKNAQGGIDYFIYEKNPADYIVIDLQDSIKIYEGRNPSTTEVRMASGMIENSLYESLQSQGLDLGLLGELEKTFAWSVDFFHLEKGDYYKVIYEEEYVDGESIGAGKVLGAQFHHDGEDFFAFYFEQDGKGNVFDEKGINLQTAFLRSPLKYEETGQTDASVEKTSASQNIAFGIDPQPIYAVGTGRVKAAYTSREQEFVLTIDHDGPYASQYRFQSAFRPEVTKGQKVKQGSLLGYAQADRDVKASMTFAFLKNGMIVDLLEVDSPGQGQVSEAHREAFEKLKAERMDQLQKLSLHARGKTIVSLH